MDVGIIIWAGSLCRDNRPLGVAFAAIQNVVSLLPKSLSTSFVELNRSELTGVPVRAGFEL